MAPPLPWGVGRGGEGARPGRGAPAGGARSGRLVGPVSVRRARGGPVRAAAGWAGAGAGGVQAALTAEMSKVSLTFSPISTPPVSSAAL